MPEKITTVSAALNAAPFTQGAQQVAQAAAQMANQVGQSSNQMGRQILDSSNSFEQLKRKFVDGYNEAQNYARVFQQLSQAFDRGKDTFELMPALLAQIERQYSLSGTQARQFAAEMMNATKSSVEHQTALRGLVGEIQNVTAARAEAARRDAAAAAAPGIAAASQQQITQWVGQQRGANAVLPGVDTRAQTQAELEAAFGTGGLSSQMDKLRASIDPLFASSKQYEEELIRITEASKVLNLSQEQTAVLVEQATARFAAANAALRGYVATTEQAQAPQQPGMVMPSQFGVQPNYTNTAARQADLEATFGGEEFQKQLDKTRASIDPLFAASKQYEEELTRIANASRLLGLSQAQTNTLMEQATARFAAANPALDSTGFSLSKLTGTTAQQQFAMRQLGVQAVQTWQGLATGQPVVMTLIQQGHQVVDVMIAASVGVGELGKAFRNTLGYLVKNPWIDMAAGATALVAVITLLAVRWQEAQQRMIDYQNRLQALGAAPINGQAASQQIERTSRQLANQTSLSRDEASQGLLDIAAAMQREGFRGDLLELGKTVENIALSLGQKFPDAAKHMADAMHDAGNAAKQAQTEGIRGFSTQLVQTITDLELKGRHPEAFNLFLKTVQDATKNTTDNLTKLGEAYRRLNNLAGGPTGQGSFASIGEAITNAFAGVLNKVAEDIEQLQRLTHPGMAPAQTGLERLLGTGAPVLTPQLQQQLNAPGAEPTVVSSGRALGTMQVIPSVAEQYGANPFIPSENIRAGLSYLSDLYRSAPGTGSDRLQITAGMYNLGPSGYAADPSAARRYQTAVYKADIGTLPQSTVDMIEYWGSKLGLSRELIDFGKRIAVVEHGGVQGAIAGRQELVWGPSNTPATTATATAPGGGGAGTTSGGAVTQDPLAAQKEALDRGAQLRADYDKTGETIRKLKEEQESLETARYKALLSGRFGDMETYNKLLEENAVKLRDTIDPTYQQTQAQQDQARSTSLLGAADQRLLSVQQEIARQRQNNPLAPTSDAAAAAQVAATIAQLGAGYTHLSAQLDLTAKQQDQVAAAWSKGATSAAEAKIQVDAYNKTLEFIPSKDPRFPALQTDLALRLQREQSSAQGVQSSQEATTNAQQLAYIQKETDTIGMNYEARQALLTNMQNELAVKQQYPLRSDIERAARVQERDTIAANTRELQREQALNDTLAQSFSSSFDTIGNAIAQAFVQGQGAAVNWANVMQSVVEQVIQTFLKLAVLNPILNNLFGQNNPVLGGAGGFLGFLGHLGGTTAAAGAAGGSLPLFAHGGVLQHYAGTMSLPGIGAFSNQIINQPTYFRAFAQGGVMGEAGAEAVMPLVRMSSGDLGVRASGGTSVQVNTPITINTTGGPGGGKMDPNAVRLLQQQLDATVKGAVRSVMLEEQRPGGDLFLGIGSNTFR